MELLDAVPPFIRDPHNAGHRAWLTIATMDDGDMKWQAAYIGIDGFAMQGFHAVGRTSQEAILNLKENLDLLYLLEAPSGIAENAE